MIQKLERVLFFSIILFLPVQLGKHFWPAFSYVEGLRIDYLSPTLYFTDILIVALFLLTLVHTKWKKVISKNLLLPSLAFLFLAQNVFVSLAPLAALYKIVKIFEFIFLGFYLTKHMHLKKDFPFVLLFLGIGVLFESVLAIAQFMNQGSLNGLFWFLGERIFSGQTPGIANANLDGRLVLRPYGTFPHPNVLAGYLVIAMTLILFNLKKTFSGIILILGTIALLLTLSRVAIVLWLGVIILWLTQRFKKKHIAIFTCLVVGVVLLTPLSSRFTSVFNSDRETVTRRQELNSAAINMFKASPLLGVGLNNFLVNMPSYQKPTSGPLWLQPAHNIYLLILAETGIVGFLFFLWFMWKTYTRSKGNYVSMIILSVILTLGFFDHYFLTLQQGQLLFTLALAFCWCQDS